MKTKFFAAWLVLTSPLAAEQTESWRSTTMEGAAILGELKYQRGDMAGADDTFKDSLNDSTKVASPRSPVMGLDLYRLAQLAVAKGDIQEAKQKLDILISRFPDSDWSEKAQRLLDALSPSQRAEAADEPSELGEASLQPEARLERLQTALKTGRSKEGLGLCQDFLARYPDHEASPEVKLIEGVLLLRTGEPARAAAVLKELSRQNGASAVKTKAVYLLGAADLATGDLDALRDAVAEIKPGRSGDKWLSLAQVWRAAADQKEGRRKEAMARYRLVLATSYESPIKTYAAAALAADLDTEGKTKDAFKAMGAAAEDAEHWGLADLAAAARISQAHLLYKLRHFPEAAGAYRTFAAGHPQHPLLTLALYQEGLSLKRINRPREAAKAFEELASKNKDSIYAADAHLQLGQLYAELGQEAKAVSNYESMGASGGKDAEIESMLLIAQVHYNKKRYRQAIPVYWKFLEAAPKDARASQVEELLLTSYWQGDRTNPGLYKAASLYPNHPIVSHISWELGAQAYKAERYREASESFKRFASDYPDSPRVPQSMFYRGECLAKLSEFDAAAGLFQDLAKRFPKSPEARRASFHAGMALFEAGDYEASAEILEKADGPDAAFNRALALQKSGAKAKTLAAFEQLLTRFPKYPQTGWAWLQVGELRQAAGRLNPAVLAFAKATSNKPQALFGIGRCRERLKQPAKARQAYEKLRALKPARDKYRLNGLLRLGLLYEIEAKPVKAMRLYAEILKLSPRDAVFEVARKRLQALTSDGTLLTSSR